MLLFSFFAFFQLIYLNYLIIIIIKMEPKPSDHVFDLNELLLKIKTRKQMTEYFQTIGNIF